MRYQTPRPTRAALLGLAALLIGAAAILPVDARGPEPEPKPKGSPKANPDAGNQGAGIVAFVRLSGEIREFTASALEVKVNEALEKKPKILVLDMDTGGGLISASESIATTMQRTSDQGVLTVAWIRNKALSGGTLVAFGCDRIVLGKDGRIGDVLPIHIREAMGQTLDVKVAEKLISPMRATLESYAERRGYPLPLVRAMVDPDHGGIARVKIRFEPNRAADRYLSLAEYQDLRASDPGSIIEAEVVIESGRLLTLNAEAARRHRFAWLTNIETRDQLVSTLAERQGYSSLEAFEPANVWWLDLLELCTNPLIRAALFAGGLLAVVLAFANPGMGVSEIMVVLCFGLCFGSAWFVGLADYIEVSVLVIGLALVAAEVYVIPGFGVTGILGIICLLASFLLTMQSFVIPTTGTEWEIFSANLLTTLVAFVMLVAGLGLIMKLLPRAKLFPGLLHSDRQAAGEEATAAGSKLSIESLIGRAGVVHTPLRPSGEVRIKGQGADEIVDAVSEETVIEAGVEVEIIGRRGFSVLVRPLKKSQEYELGPDGDKAPGDAKEVEA